MLWSAVSIVFTLMHTEFEILEAVMVSKVTVYIILQWPACKCKMLILSFHYINLKHQVKMYVKMAAN
jgi:hypothetical protein